MFISKIIDKVKPIAASERAFIKKIKGVYRTYCIGLSGNKSNTNRVNNNEPIETNWDSAKNKFVFKNWKTTRTTHKGTNVVLGNLGL